MPLPLKVGDKAHYWGRRSPQERSIRSGWCHRVIIRETSERWARVERIGSATAVPIQTVEMKRLRPGWNNWRDQEGREIQ